MKTELTKEQKDRGIYRVIYGVEIPNSYDDFNVDVGRVMHLWALAWKERFIWLCIFDLLVLGLFLIFH